MKYTKIRTICCLVLVSITICGLSYADTSIIQNDQTTQPSLPDDVIDTPLSATNHDDYEDTQASSLPVQDILSLASCAGRIITQITIVGNERTSQEAIQRLVPFTIGQRYDPNKRGDIISNIYYGLKRFTNIVVRATLPDADSMHLIIEVTEKKALKEIIFTGNKNLKSSEIRKQLELDDLTSLDEHELPRIVYGIKKLYLEKGYQQVIVDTSYVVDHDDASTVTFTIEEGKQSLIKRILFTGNCSISDKELRSAILTKEDWLLGFLDRSGSYHPERIEYGDRQLIEHYYQNHGFLQAKVVAAHIHTDPCTQEITLTFDINEGSQFTVASVTVQDDEELSQQQLRAVIPIAPGQLYSRDAIMSSIKRLEVLWGNLGYLFTHVNPSIIPNETTKEVTVAFSFDKGTKVRLHRIEIKGNKKTRDKVIRRKIMLQEGSLITQNALQATQNSIESLGYFEARNGVSTKIKKIDKSNADVDIIVKEMRTGHINGELGYGGVGTSSFKSPVDGISVKGNLSDTNLFGLGINLNLSASWAKDEQTIVFHLAQPWLFDEPILGALDIYHRRPTYSEMRNITDVVNEKLTGGSVAAGFIFQPSWYLFADTQLLARLGIDNISYQKTPQARLFADQYQPILQKSFTPGKFVWTSATLEQDMRNHPMHPTAGYKWRLTSKIAAPSFGDDIGFYKVSLEATWHTALIQEYNLVLRLHSYFGVAMPLRHHTIPYGELFHIGGDHSVRGFTYGEIGPKFLADSIGATQAFFINAELIFPITKDFSMKGVLFYDGGAGWRNPYVDDFAQEHIRNNSFDYRHAVGVGIRLLRPMPVKVDWGFKIDPRSNRLDRRQGESASQVHFGMSYDYDF